MKAHRGHEFFKLANHQLPGPDTETKRAALESNDPRLRLLLLESARVGWPKGFTNDLYLHDRDTLANYPGQDLIWVLRENGTHLYPTQCTTSAEAAYYRRVIEYWSGDHKLNAATKNDERAKFFLLTETDLIPITWKTADQEYAASVFRTNETLAQDSGRLFLPIVFPETSMRPFEIFPHVANIDRQGNLNVQPCGIEVVEEMCDELSASAATPRSSPPRTIEWPTLPAETTPLITFPASTAQLDETFSRVKCAVDPGRLATSRVIIAGVGGASAVALNLVRAGLGEVVLVDHDQVALSNLATQPYRRQDVGRPKVECLAEAIREFNPLAGVVACPWRIEDLGDEDFAQLARRPFRTWQIHGKSYWGMLGNDVTIDAQLHPSLTLLIGTTDSFLAQAHINRLALRFGIPSLCSQIYANGKAAEITYTAPGITPACHRCILESRYQAYLDEGFQNDVTPHGCPLSSINRINSLCEFVALGLLHVGTNHPRWGQMIERLGNRNLLQVRMDPSVDLDIFSRVFGTADRERIFSDETVWLPQSPNDGKNGRPRCPDCNGTGDLRHAHASQAMLAAR